MTTSQSILLNGVGKYGIATVIALYLVYNLSQGLPAIQEEFEKDHATLKAGQQYMFFQHEYISEFLRQVCINTSKTSEAIEVCKTIKIEHQNSQ